MLVKMLAGNASGANSCTSDGCCEGAQKIESSKKLELAFRKNAGTIRYFRSFPIILSIRPCRDLA